MDILFADNMKRELRLFLWFLRLKLKRHYKVTMEDIHNDMKNCGNPVIAKIWKIVVDLSKKIEEKHQREMMLDFPEIGFWFVYKDTGYSPMFMYILKQILDKKEELYPLVMKYYKEPENMYVNRWHDTKKRSDELKNKGELPNMEGHMGEDEKVFVPKYQRDKIDKFIKKLQKEYKK